MKDLLQATFEDIHTLQCIWLFFYKLNILQTSTLHQLTNQIIEINVFYYAILFLKIVLLKFFGTQKNLIA